MMIDPNTRENEYNNIINALNTIKKYDTEAFNEFNTKLNILEDRNYKLANAFEEVIKILRS